MGFQVTCGDTTILDDDSVDKFEFYEAIKEHIYRCSGSICYTSHGIFTVIDGILFEAVDY